MSNDKKFFFDLIIYIHKSRNKIAPNMPQKNENIGEACNMPYGKSYKCNEKKRYFGRLVSQSMFYYNISLVYNALKIISNF